MSAQSAAPTAPTARAVFDQFDSRLDVASLSSGSHSGRLSSGYLCLKVLLMAANLVTLIFGIVLLAVASYALTSQINSLTGVTLPAGIICLGVFVLLLSICGALAVWHESRVGLLLYALFLLCIVISLFALGIAVYVEKDQAGSYISRGWQLSPPDVRQALEVEFACCGLNQFPVNATSCPPPSQVAIPQNQTCLPLLVSAFQSNYVTAGGCGIAFAVLMGCFIALAVLLVRGVGIKRQQTAEAEDSRRASRAAMERSGGGGVGAGVDYEGTNTEGEDSFDDEDDEEDDEEEDDELT